MLGKEILERKKIGSDVLKKPWKGNFYDKKHEKEILRKNLGKEF